MEPKDWMEDASSNELFGLEPKWQRVTYTFAIEMIKTTESTEGAKESSALYNRTTESESCGNCISTSLEQACIFGPVAATPSVRFGTFCPLETLDVLVPIEIQLVC